MLDIYTDGASRGNPGKSALSGVIVRDSHIIMVYSEFIGITTNNVAEYSAVIKALEEARLLGETSVKIYSDSELAMSQINGLYKVKAPHLAELLNILKEKKKLFKKIAFEYVPRENSFTRIADALCAYVLGPK
jgi:ribonuclease HI